MELNNKTMDELWELLQCGIEAKAFHDEQIKLVTGEIFSRSKEEIDNKLMDKDEPFGTVEVDGFKFTIPKSVTWDQKQLADLVKEIKESGGMVENYIDSKYSVSETKLKKWPDVIRKRFISARSVKRGTVKIEKVSK